MDLKFIRKIMRFFESKNLELLELKHKGSMIKLRKFPGSDQKGVMSKTGVDVNGKKENESLGEGDKSEGGKIVVVESPIVGTFYRSSSPDSPPFVEVGDTVKTGQILCIVEAMKLMNEIESDVEGRIIEIVADDGAPVEFGEPLFKIERK